MKAVPSPALRGLVVVGCALLLSACGVQRPVTPVAPSAEPAPAATPTGQPSTPGPAPETSADPSATPSTSPSLGELRPPPAPSVKGNALFGTKLTISQGAWQPAPVALGYQWLRDGEPIAAATASTYRLAADDITHRISVAVTGSRDGFATLTRKSGQVGPVTPAKLKPSTPKLSGIVKVGHTLTATTTAWGPGTVTLSWQWRRDGAAIAAATRSTYKLVVADHGHAITVAVTGKRKNYQTDTRRSDATAKVGPGTLKPAPDPTVSGTARVGDPLTAHAGEWGPGTVTLTYQWFRSLGTAAVAIPGATGAHHTPTVDDLYAQVRVRVTASRKGYLTVARYSAYTAAVANGELVAPTPLISGPTIVGNKLTADPGTWGPGTVELLLQWYRDGKPIPRANATTHLLMAIDAGHTLTVRVTGSRAGYDSRTVESAATASIKAR